VPPSLGVRHLDGKLPPGAHSQSLAEAQSRAFAMMQSGQPFVQYYRSGPSGALVQKNVRLVYVPSENKAEGLGKLYWGEVSPPPHSRATQRGHIRMPDRIVMGTAVSQQA